MRLEGKIALVTGASRGLGKAAAFALAAAGARVVVAARTEEANPNLPGTIHQTAEEIVSRGGQAVALRADLSRPEDMDMLVQRVLDQWGGLDVVLHNAAAAARSRLVETPMRRWDLLFNINARATAALLVNAYAALKTRGVGHFIAVTLPPMMPGDLGGGFSPVYRLSKNTAAQIVAVGAMEVQDEHIAVCGIWPGDGRDTVGGRQARGWDTPRGLHASLFGDAIVEITAQEPRTYNGRFVTDDQVLREAGITDFSRYQPATEYPEF